jgi:hypothetical protein
MLLQASLVANGILLAVLLVLVARWSHWRERANGLASRGDYAIGLAKGKQAVLDTVSYQQEIYEVRTIGLLKREAELKVREHVLVGKLRVATVERTVQVATEINEQTLGHLVRLGTSIVAVGRGQVLQVIAPGVQRWLASRSKEDPRASSGSENTVSGSAALGRDSLGG